MAWQIISLVFCCQCTCHKQPTKQTHTQERRQCCYDAHVCTGTFLKFIGRHWGLEDSLNLYLIIPMLGEPTNVFDIFNIYSLPYLVPNASYFMEIVLSAKCLAVSEDCKKLLTSPRLEQMSSTQFIVYLSPFWSCVVYPYTCLCGCCIFTITWCCSLVQEKFCRSFGPTKEYLLEGHIL